MLSRPGAISATREALLLDSCLPNWSAEDLERLADSLLRASDVLIDELFWDLDLLTTAPEGKPLPVNGTLQLVSLPQNYSTRFSPYLVKRLVLSVGAMTARLLQEWHGPDTVAECLLLDLLVENVAQWIEGQELDLPGDWRSGLEDALYLDFDHRVLHERSSWVGVPIRFTFDHWFDSIHGESQPPYVVLP